jgi:hypothetical protein
METKRAVVMVECRVELLRPMDPAPVDDRVKHRVVFGTMDAPAD